MMVDRHGVGVATPTVRTSGKRGRVPARRLRLLRGLVYKLLTETYGLTNEEAHTVMTGAGSRSQLRRRAAALKPIVDRYGGVMLTISLVSRGVGLSGGDRHGD